MTPHYLTYTDYPDLGLATSDPCDFSTACDLYDKAREEGLQATVMRIVPGKGKGAGMALDVTDDAIAQIRRRCRARDGKGYQMPAWLLEEVA